MHFDKSTDGTTGTLVIGNMEVQFTQAKDFMTGVFHFFEFGRKVVYRMS